MTSWIQHFKTYFIAMLIVFTSNSIAFAQSNCGFFEKKITFKDGSVACMKDVPFMNTTGLLVSMPNETFTSIAKSKSTFAIATTENPQMCPFVQSMFWDNGDDAYRASQKCEEKLRDAVNKLGKANPSVTCSCSVIAENERSSYTKNEFMDKTSSFLRQVSIGNKPLAIVDEQIKLAKLKAEEEAKAAEAKRLEDERLIAMRERQKIKDEEEQKRQLANPTVMASRRALVVGNDSYKYAEKLQTAREDAKTMADALTKVGYSVTLRLDQSEKELKAILREFKDQTNAGDEILIFYAGHGIEINGKNYLIPIDNLGQNPGQIAEDAVDLKNSVLDPLEEKKTKITLAIIDACRNNPFKQTVASRSVGSRGLTATTPATGQLIVYSAGTGQTALDRLGPDDNSKNGLFTRIFVKEMLVTGVPLRQTIYKVRQEVYDLAKTIGHDQVPAIYDEVLGDFYFSK